MNMPHKIDIRANFQLTKGVDAPDGYKVSRHDGVVVELSALPSFQEMSAVLTLAGTLGLTEWVKSKAYDVLWDYLAALWTKKASKRPREFTLDVRGASGTRAKLTMDGLADIDEARMKLKERVLTDGTTEQTLEVVLKTKPNE